MKVTNKIEITNEDNMILMSRYPDNYFDLAIVDPPYGIGAENHAGKSENGWKQWKTKNWDNSTPDIKYFKELIRVSKNQIIWGGNYFANFLDNSQCWIFWDKGQRDFSLADGELAWTSFKKSLRVFEMSRASANRENRIHPTQKPIALYKWLLEKYAKPNDKILDTHLGSGSIAIAFDEMLKYWKMNELDIEGAELVACELDEEYFNASVKRIKNHISQLTLF